MSKNKSRNSLLFSSNRSTQSASDKDELIAMKFLMDKPNLDIYPLSVGVEDKKESNTKHSYPDFKPWRESTPTDPGSFNDAEALKENNASYLNKGYYEPPAVPNEYSSARSLVQASLFSSSDMPNEALEDLSRMMAGAFKSRNESINKIKHDTHQFKIPPRVTLTALKKEAWLRDLADPEIPLSKISGKLPHGIRNKILVESMCNKNVPLPRAIWFTKCILYSEIQALKKKYHAKLTGPRFTSTIVNYELHWLHEWTQQVADYVQKFAREMNGISLTEKKSAYMSKLSYLLRYLQSLYLECLIDRRLFLSCIINILREGLPLEAKQVSELISMSWEDSDKHLDLLNGIEKHYGQRLIALMLIKSFWKVILPLDYLCKELSEALLLNYYFLRRASTFNPKQPPQKQNSNALPSKLKLTILDLVAESIKYLFKHNSNTFILPNYWVLTSEELSSILLNDKDSKMEEVQLIKDQLKTIKYRNESLILNSKHIQAVSNEQQHDFATKAKYLSQTTKDELVSTEADYWFINRSQGDLLKIVDSLDRYRLDDGLAILLRPQQENSRWRIYLKLLIHWCITDYRDSAISSQGILIACNFIKGKVLYKRIDSQKKAEFESEILEIIYQVVSDPTAKIKSYSLYVLINELYQLKIITISSYIRRLIASGVFYVSPEESSQKLILNNEISTHLSILKNLPVTNNKQCDSILRKWVLDDFNFKTKFDTGKIILQENIIENLLESKEKAFVQGSGIEYFQNLEVGLKFLLINWLTTQLKNTIMSSTKLIHVYPSTISILYDLFCACDNLTVFFKGIIKLILRNDGGIIIFYLDSLYLIAKLVVRHFKLIKYITTSPSEVPTILELMKLILLHYKDLQSRDFDYTKFRSIWIFFESMISSSELQFSSVWDHKTMQKPKNKGTVALSSTEIIAEWSNPWQNVSPSTEDLKTVLDDIIAEPVPLLSEEELGESCKTLKVTLASNTVLDNFSQLLIKFDETLGNLQYDEEVSLIRLIVHHDRLLKASKESTDVSTLIKAHIGEMSDSTKILLLLKKLLCYELIDYLLVVQLLTSENYGFSAESNYDTIMQVLFGKNVRTGIFSNQQVMLQILRETYLTKNSVSVLPIILKSFKRTQSHVPVEQILKENMLSVLRGCCLYHIRDVIDELVKHLTNSEIIRVCNELAGISPDSSISLINDIPVLGKVANEFSLPICQILLRTITLNELEYLGTLEASRQIEIITESLLYSFHSDLLKDNSFFGEITNYCGPEYKYMFLRVLETKFLTCTKFDGGRLSLCTEQGENLFPILKDFFKKFSVSYTRDAVTGELFTELNKFLQELLPIAKSPSIDENTAVDLQNAISVYLRIIIIHKVPLITTIITKDGEKFTFVRNLIELLKSNFLSSNNESLRILLYDLLLLMKSSLTLALTLQANGMFENSPAATQDDFNGNQEIDAPPTEQHSKQLFVNDAISSISRIFNLPEPSTSNPFEAYKKEEIQACSIMLDEEELNCGSDFAAFNDSGLVAVPVDKKRSSSEKVKPFKIKSFEIIEGSTNGSEDLNDSCINLLMFGAYVLRENPL